ncbi:MAG: tol-pal system-associated acyl-CoA thioesterase [Rhodospirillales bacterium]|nr:tol-pal system-associated acyl-CoA thioesterase [Rhodospirillales bacterium]
MTNKATPSSGYFRNGMHVFPVRVYFEDTDTGGIVYHADYLRYAERARTEMLRCLGIEHTVVLAEHQVFFVVREMHVQFHAPARLDDMLEVHTGTGSVSGARLRLSQTIRTRDAVLVEFALTLACVARDGRPRRWPAPLAATFANLTRR